MAVCLEALSTVYRALSMLKREPIETNSVEVNSKSVNSKSLGESIQVSDSGTPQSSNSKQTDQPVESFGKSSIVSLLDQAIVSGTRFAIGVIVARACGVDAIGLYALGLSLIMFAMVTSQSLVMTPLTNFIHREQEPLRRRAVVGSAILMTILIVAIVTVATLLVAAGFWIFGSFETAAVVAVASLAVGPVSTQEMIRRYAYARHETITAFRLDLLTSGLTLLTLGWLWFTSSLTPAVAFVVIAATNGVVVAGWWMRHRNEFSFENSIAESRKLLGFGRWVFASEIALYFKNYANTWLVFAFCGLTGAGFFAACVSLMRATNPVILGIANIAEPRLATAFARRGAGDVKRVALLLSIALMVAVLPIAAVLMLGSHWLLVTIYGSSYGAFWPVVVILAAATITAAASYPLGNALQAIHRPELAFKVRVTTLLVGLLAAVVLIPWMGIEGAALGMLATALLSISLRMIEFFRVFGTSQRQPSKLDVAKESQ
ncbi:MAG: oligosaccharide flippase family protein [Planctomycetota bacterium]